MLAVEAADVEIDLVAAGRDAGKTDDAVRRGAAHDVEHHGAGARAFDHDVRLEIAEVAGVIGGAEIARERGLGAVFGAIEDVHLEAALLAEQRRQQADRTGAGDRARRAVARPPRA